MIAINLLYIFGVQQVFAQGVNNFWLGGYANWSGTPHGGVNLNFLSGSLDKSYIIREIDFYRCNTNISDNVGERLISSNGSFLGNAMGDTLMNGTGLSPSFYTELYPEGLHINQAVLVLPQPGGASTYLLFHSTIDDGPNSAASFLYATTINMEGDGGLGEVVIKNEVVIEDALNPGKITAVRHANGRDWWVFCRRTNSNIFQHLLVTPEGVTVDGTQAIGIFRPADAGQVCFSPDGTKFAYYWGVQDLEVFDFDRCTGLFSNPVFIPIDDTNGGGGVAFSPNSRFLYVPSVADVYQFDTEAADIEASMVIVATWDGFYSPSEPFATAFSIAQLAPDGKIYIGTGNSTFHLHVIHNPDQPGLACNLEQHGVELDRWYSNSLPNHPNYHLGPIDGSVCDSLGINVGVVPPLHRRGEGGEVGVRAHPNPSTGQFTISYAANSEVGSLEVIDAAGRVVLQERIPQWSTIHNFDISDQEHGAYTATIRWGVTKLSTYLTVLR